jgi:hypothetical protein
MRSIALVRSVAACSSPAKSRPSVPAPPADPGSTCRATRAPPGLVGMSFLRHYNFEIRPADRQILVELIKR